MSTINDSEKVLIIGGGIGGLALAQYLRKQNIAFEVFERDTSAGSRAQGWAVALVECLPHLREYLPSDLGSVYSTSVTGLNDVADQLTVVDMDTGETIARVGTADPKSKGHLLRAGRSALRNFFWQNIPVSTGKHFSHYAEDKDGVTAFFRDGTSARGSILIGADGSSSHVRAQLLGASKGAATINPFIPLVGECTLTREQYEPIAAISNAAIISGNTKYRMVMGRRSTSATGDTADHFYVMAYRVDDPIREAAWTHSASKEELFAKAQAIAADIPSNMAQIVQLAGLEGTVPHPYLFREFVPWDAEDMPRGRVSVLGDAAHGMAPFKGAGANTAVEDAFDLMQAILQKQKSVEVSSGSPVHSWEDVIAEYNKVMCPRGQKMVLASRKAGDEKTGIAVIVDRMG